MESVSLRVTDVSGVLFQECLRKPLTAPVHLPIEGSVCSVSSPKSGISILAGWTNGCSSIQIWIRKNSYIKEIGQKCNDRLNLRRAKEKKMTWLIGWGSYRQFVNPLMTWPASVGVYWFTACLTSCIFPTIPQSVIYLIYYTVI